MLVEKLTSFLVAICYTKGIVKKSTSNTPVENIEKPIKNTNKTNIKSKVDIDTLKLNHHPSCRRGGF